MRHWKAVNWNRVLAESKIAHRYNKTYKLKKYFGNKEYVDICDFIEYTFSGKNEYSNIAYTFTQIGEVARRIGLSTPQPYANFSAMDITPLSEVVEYLKNNLVSHSLYAAAIALVLREKKSVLKVRLSEYPQAFVDFPPWAKIVIDRQYRLCKNNFLQDSDPFFFQIRDNQVVELPDSLVRRLDKLFEVKFGLSTVRYGRYIRLFAGLNNNSAIVFNAFNLTRKALDKVRRDCVNVLCQADGIVAICLDEVDNGVYLLHGLDDKFYVCTARFISTCASRTNEYSKQIQQLGYSIVNERHIIKQ